MALCRHLAHTSGSISDMRKTRYVALPNISKQFLQKISEWVRARKLLFTLLKTIDSAMDVDERKISIVDMPAEAITLGELNDYSNL